jgi:hypothetical protein
LATHLNLACAAAVVLSAANGALARRFFVAHDADGLEIRGVDMWVR